MSALRCTVAGPCDFHRDGGPATARCPYYCDAGDCRRKAVVESRGSGGRSYCRQHAPRAGRPRSTGSWTTAPISFRVGAETRAELERRGSAAGLSADQEAKRIVTAALQQLAGP